MEAGIGELPLTGHADADKFTSFERAEKKRLHSPPDLFSADACSVPSLRFITGQEEAVDVWVAVTSLLFSDAIVIVCVLRWCLLVREREVRFVCLWYLRSTAVYISLIV